MKNIPKKWKILIVVVLLSLLFWALPWRSTQSLRQDDLSKAVPIHGVLTFHTVNKRRVSNKNICINESGYEACIEKIFCPNADVLWQAREKNSIARVKASGTRIDTRLWHLQVDGKVLCGPQTVKAEVRRFISNQMWIAIVLTLVLCMLFAFEDRLSKSILFRPFKVP